MEKNVHHRIKLVAFLSLTEKCSTKKTCLLLYIKLMRACHYTLQFLNQKLLAWFSERESMLICDIKKNFKGKNDGNLNCPLCRQLHENFEHIFRCNSGIFCRRSLTRTTQDELATVKDTEKKLKKDIGKFLIKYQWRNFL